MKQKRAVLAAAGIVAAVGVAFFWMRGDSSADGERSIDPPEEYRIGGVDVIALPVMSDGVAVYQEKPANTGTDADTDTGTKDGAAPEVKNTADAVAYRYEGLSGAGTLVSAYTAVLTSPDLGFDIVDEALCRADAPDFSAESGDVNLAHRGAEAGKVMRLQLTWAAGTCTVVTDAPEGEITDPPAPEGMTMEEALDYVRGLPPALLGLEGSSMEDYRIYALDGMAFPAFRWGCTGQRRIPIQTWWRAAFSWPLTRAVFTGWIQTPAPWKRWPDKPESAAGNREGL